MPIAADVKLGKGTRIFHPELVNLYGCSVGDESTIGPFVEIQCDVVIGTRCKISSHTFICEDVTIEDEVFVGHGVMFINDRYPRATTEEGELKTRMIGSYYLPTSSIAHRSGVMPRFWGVLLLARML